MGYKHKSKAQPPAADAEDDEEADPARLAKAKAANARRVRLSVKAICEELNCREDIAAEVLNVVIIKCSKPVRAALRLHGAMQQERFLGVKHAIRSRRGLCARGGGDATSISGICLYSDLGHLSLSKMVGFTSRFWKVELGFGGHL
jgi:hypothetical protein